MDFKSINSTLQNQFINIYILWNWLRWSQTLMFNKKKMTASKIELVGATLVGSGVEWCRMKMSETSHLPNKWLGEWGYTTKAQDKL